MANSTRTIQLWESPYDLTFLVQNDWNFQVAKSVVKGDGPPTYNTIWQSRALAPNIRISWDVVYGLNWTATIPDDGLSITTNGIWQRCDKGQVFDLDNRGVFVPSLVAPTTGFMKVGSINYKYPGVAGIHIVVGVQNTEGTFDPIFIDPVALDPNSSAQYQPLEKVKWWYETGLNSATMITTDITNAEERDLSKPNSNNQYYCATTFLYDDGKWITTDDKPSQN